MNSEITEHLVSGMAQNLVPLMGFLAYRLSLKECKQIVFFTFHRYECLATNSVGTANRTVLLDVKADSPSLTYQSPAPIPLPPILGHGMPSHQHSISAMYGSAVFLHCPESTGSTRGTIWQLPSKTIIEYQYRYLTFHTFSSLMSWNITQPNYYYYYIKRM